MPDYSENENLALTRPEPTVLTVRGYEVDVPPPQDAFTTYIRMIYKRRITVLLVLSVVMLTTTIATLKQQPIYRTKVLLQIDRETPNVVSLKDLLGEMAVDDSAFLETCYKNLQSRVLATRVVDKMHLDRLPEFGGQPQPANVKPSPLAKPGQSEEAAERAVSALLLKQMVVPLRNSRLVEVYFESTDSDLAARIANTFAQSYIEQNMEWKLQATEQASEMISKQLVGMQAQLEKAEEELQSYARNNSILMLDQQQAMATDKVRQLQEEHSKAEADRVQKEAIYEQIRASDSPETFVQDETYTRASGQLEELKRQYAELQLTFTPEYPKAKKLKLQIDELEKTLKAQKANQLRKMADEYKAAVKRSSLLARSLTEATREFNALGDRSIRYSILKRKSDADRQLYDGLLQKLREASISAGLRASNIRVADPAQVPRAPYKPQIFSNLAASFLVGLLLAVGLAVFREYLDDSVKTPDDVARHLRMPLLAVIPSSQSLLVAGKYGSSHSARYGYGYGYGKSRPRPALVAASSEEKLALTVEEHRLKHMALLSSDHGGPLAEAFRSLRTSVLLSTPGAPPRTLLITSSQPGEGKTTVSINLAIVLSQLGKRVLLVDSDMRKPRIGILLKLPPSEQGLSTYLAGQCSLEDAVVSTAVPNLFVLPCGPFAPNPAELISSGLQKLLAQTHEIYDYVLFDSPPILHVTDGRIIACKVDAVVLVLHGGSTPRQVVNQAKRYLLEVNAHLIGVVVNNLDLSVIGYDYSYRYYRKYGYYGFYGGGYDNAPPPGPAEGEEKREANV